MIPGLLGTKIKQTQTFTETGMRIPVTLIQVGPCWVTQIKNADTYHSIQIGFGTTKHVAKAQAGEMKKAGLTIQPRFLREIRVPSVDQDITVGRTVSVGDVFAPGDIVRVNGTSKGKGFAGVVKRHHFSGGPRTHGQSDRERAPGSIGQTTTPGRVYKGKRMAGRMGNEKITITGLTVIAVDQEKNTLTVKGLVPGPAHGLVLLRKES